ncbi:hypothetical protein CC78DRAFT_532260 [Lojkania enalia]|uniref:Muramidase n=1 Tax=Lojkania enalia TaxID=147567 RepID=A0A9P4KA99_9PLEO|nr:hypothetical protein CC78DRAFT_532260 [Didymosphaeria enalia]
MAPLRDTKPLRVTELPGDTECLGDIEPPILNIRRILQRNPNKKLGFVVYRCTYADDAQWAQFMGYLNSQTQRNLKKAGLGDFSLRLDWNVQQDPSLDGADFEEAREKFRRWTAEGGDFVYTYPARACVIVDQHSVESVLEYEERDDRVDTVGTTWVWLVSKYDEGPADWEEDSDEEDEVNESDDEADDASDEGPDEKGAKDKVRDTMVGIHYLLPRVYSFLDNIGWHSILDFDGGVACP